MTIKGTAEIRAFYQAAWQHVGDALQTLLVDNGFTLKDSDIGNAHGEVYAYAVAMSDREHPLYLVRIAPTHTGKASIKLTFNDRGAQRASAERIKTALAATPLGKPEKTAESRYAISYLLLNDAPPATPAAAGEQLLAEVGRWLPTIGTEAPS